MLLIVTLSAHLLLLMSLISGIHSVDPLITCEAGTFTAGEPASVICNFRINITATKRSIAMTRYPPHAPSDSRGKEVLLCPWLSGEMKHDCFIQMANYNFDDVLTDHLSVRIPAVSAEQAGLYMCFFVPPEETQAHSCELRVQARPETTTTTNTTTTATPDTKGENPDLLAVILPVFLIIAVVTFGVLFFLHRRRAKRDRSGKNVELTEIPESTKPLIPEPGKPRPIPPEKRSKEELLLEDLQLSNSKLQHLMTLLAQEMAKGLNEATGSEADIKMFPTFVSPCSEGSDNRDCLVVELSTNRLKASIVSLQGNIARISKSAGCPIPEDIKCGTVSQLFDFVADYTNKFIKDEILSGKMPFALIVGFPCKYKRIDKCCLVKWTKELSYNETHNGDLHALLSEAVVRRAKENKIIPFLWRLEVAAVINDSVSTLMSAAFNNSNCKIGLVLDSGFNACYVEDWTYAEMDSTAGEKPREMIINTELGALGENGCLDFCSTVYDKELNKHSSSPGSQILEKMVGGRYIGELVRLVLEGMTRKDLLFQKVPLTCALFQRDSFSTRRVLIIEGDTDEPYKTTSEVLDGLGATNYTEGDLETVRHVCRAVCDRAAYLASASLASLINYINQPEVTVVIDGYLYQRHPRFHDLMHSKTLELINPGLKFYLELPICDRAVGAARIAAASIRSRKR